MSVRLLSASDGTDALALYAHLVGDQQLGDLTDFAGMVDHPGTQVRGAFENGALVAVATLHILPNITQQGRSYALIENVVTHRDHRGQGFGRAVMNSAMEAAWAAGCYKIMLLSGKKGQARGFYEALGFGADEKWGMTIRRAPTRQSNSDTSQGGA
ncbi:GNAT family N-acetyltransferase [Tateyamaria armeniaca]|uniref:GNAT family N-acetyltransferase n=1 Tax=Tateyamaria armeniaca TaxID=2518930 RepID=A0ABW8USJ1_9RHOB